MSIWFLIKPDDAPSVVLADAAVKFSEHDRDAPLLLSSTDTDEAMMSTILAEFSSATILSCNVPSSSSAPSAPNK